MGVSSRDVATGELIKQAVYGGGLDDSELVLAT